MFGKTRHALLRGRLVCLSVCLSVCLIPTSGLGAALLKKGSWRHLGVAEEEGKDTGGYTSQAGVPEHTPPPDRTIDDHPGSFAPIHV